MKPLKWFLVKNNLPQIYCDLDGVLASFIDGANIALQKQGLHTFDSAHWTQDSLEDADRIRWSVINQTKNFWIDLPWTSDGRQLWSVIRPYNPHVLSHAVVDKSPTCKIEKLQWIEQNLHIYDNSKIHLVLKRSDKRLFAKNVNGSPNLLIDDYEKTVIEFIEHGGIGIHHKNSTDTIQQLKALGYK